MLNENQKITSNSVSVSLNEPSSYRNLDDVEVRQKDNNYYGVFAKKNIPEGTTLLTITTENKLLIPDRFSVQFTEDQHLDSNYIQWLKFTNHTCDPNIRFEVTPEQVKVLAARDLSTGEELSFNYLTTEYDMHEKFTCNCESKKCYGEIGGFKNLSSEAKLELLPKVTPYLFKKYHESI